MYVDLQMYNLLIACNFVLIVLLFFELIDKKTEDRLEPVGIQFYFHSSLFINKTVLYLLSNVLCDCDVIGVVCLYMMYVGFKS